MGVGMTCVCNSVVLTFLPLFVELLLSTGCLHLTPPPTMCRAVPCASCCPTPLPHQRAWQAMVVRGFLGPEQHHLYLMRSNETSLLANTLALGALGGLIALVGYLK